MVPDLCESIDYAEVQGALFPRVAVCCNDIIVSNKWEILTRVVIACVYEDTHSLGESSDTRDVPVHGQNARPGMNIQ